jgi:hypothetical protein
MHDYLFEQAQPRAVALAAVFVLALGACGTDAGGSGGDDVSLGLGDTAPPSTLGTDCAADTDCGDDGVCYRGVCVATCVGPADCPETANCSRDGDGRLLCAPRAYAAAVGALCGTDGVCAEGTKCLGTPYSAFARCAAACNDDTDCPMDHSCEDVAKDQRVCRIRAFCSTCDHDGQCGAGQACVESGGQRFCSKACTAGSTECPRYAACSDVGGGDFRCVHKAGGCVGDGGLCEPCTGSHDCAVGGQCLTYTHTKESFCSSACAGGCPSGYECNANVNQCVPSQAKGAQCVATLSKTMEVGDIFDDYAMVGMVDTDDDGSLVGEDARIIQMSDFAEHHELILLNVSAVWCSACQAETKEMRVLYKKFYPRGLILFQTLYDGQKPGQPMTFPLLKAWNAQLKPAGVVGMDPERWVMQYNVGSGTPLNMLIDAKTRKVLYKVNGYNGYTLQKAIDDALKAKGR